jgi:ABC-2 type transport system permease protein
MTMIRSWAALLNREYLEHRMAFLYFPLGILVLLTLAAASGLLFNHTQIRLPMIVAAVPMLKVFEFGYLILAALWLAYLAVALFFYFGDAFAADRRNNAMFFWKSMPVTDLKVLSSKLFAGVLLFPLILFAVSLVSGLLNVLVVNLSGLVLPDLLLPSPIDMLASFVQISIFAFVYFALTLLWFVPFLAWVGGLSAVFGRWSLVLAFLIPGLLVVIENIALYGYGPRGGYVWAYLSKRLQFGLDEHDFTAMALQVIKPFSAGEYIGRLVSHIDWTNMAVGLVFAGAVIWLASEYRRRRLV